MIVNTIIAVALLANTILIHMEWKRIENLEKWMLHLLEQTDDELLRRWKGASDGETANSICDMWIPHGDDSDA